MLNIAKGQKKNYTDLIRTKIDEILFNQIDEATKARVTKILKELRGPFAYVKSKKGKARATHERAIRKRIADRIEAAFKLK